MKITDCYVLDDILKEMETSLAISASDYELRDMDKFIENVRARISRQYSVDLIHGRVDDVVTDLEMYQSAVAVFMENVAAVHAKLCGYGQLIRFTAKTTLSMSNVNYIGYTEVSIKTFLTQMRLATMQPTVEDAVNAIKQKLASVTVSKEKRMFVVMLVAYDLGLYELAAACAEILYCACF